MQSKNAVKKVAIAVSLVFSSVVGAAPVAPNNPSGDAFTNSGATNTGQAIGSSGWYYNNVRNGGTVGINNTYPHSGDGSVYFSGISNSKADIEYLPGAVANGAGNYSSTASLGAFSLLSSMSYDWYRDSVSTAGAHLHPSLRVLLDRDGNLSTTGDQGGLVFERTYNGLPTPADQWVSDVVSATTNIWNFGLGLANTTSVDGNGNPHDDTLADWQAFMPNAVIMGFSSGIGSGWDPYTGAVDNIAWTINGVMTASSFEAAAVPEPGSLALAATALIGLGLSRRSRRRG